MSRGPVDELVDGIEKMGETSFLDLPDDCLRRIIEKLDLPSRLKLRLNKRLDKLQLSVNNNLENIRFRPIGNYSCNLTLEPSSRHFSFQKDGFKKVEEGFRRLALNTYANQIRVAVDCSRVSEPLSRVIDELLKFEADSVSLYAVAHDEDGYPHIDLPQFDLSRLLIVAQNARDVSIRLICTSLTSEDFIAVRNAMIERSCKMKSFSVIVEEETYLAVLDACFGVTMEEERNGRTYRAKDESVELYLNGYRLRDLYHYEGNFEMHLWRGKNRFECVLEYQITLTMYETKVEPDRKDLVKFNHAY